MDDIYIINPATGRKVLKNGKIGKKILITHFIKKQDTIPNTIPENQDNPKFNNFINNSKYIALLQTYYIPKDIAKINIKNHYKLIELKETSLYDVFDYCKISQIVFNSLLIQSQTIEELNAELLEIKKKIEITYRI